MCVVSVSTMWEVMVDLSLSSGDSKYLVRGLLWMCVNDEWGKINRSINASFPHSTIFQLLRPRIQDLEQCIKLYRLSCF